VGRNSAVILFAAELGLMLLGVVESVTVLKDVGITEPRLRLKLKGPTGKTSTALPLQQREDVGVKEKVKPSAEVKEEVKGGEETNKIKLDTGGVQFVENCEIDVHQFVVALGADAEAEAGPWQILDKSIREKLEPVYDMENRFSADAESTVVALKDDNNLAIVGAAVFRCGGVLARNLLQGKEVKENDGLKKKSDALTQGYSNIAKMLCACTRPPEGIAILKAAIKAYTGYLEPTDLASFNWKTADRKEMKKFIKTVYSNLSDAECQTVADEIMTRQSTTWFGFNRQQFLDGVAALVADKTKKVGLNPIPK
jgi:hypothetical protein